MAQVSIYTVGYSKGSFAMTLKILENIVKQDCVFEDCKSKKQYKQRLTDILTALAEDSRLRERFLATGQLNFKVDPKGKLLKVW